MTAINNLLTGLRAIRKRVGPLWWYSGLIFAVSRVGDLLNMYLKAFYLPGALSQNELGAVEPVTRLVGFATIPLGVVGMVGAKYLSTYHATSAYGKIKRFMRDMSLLAVVSGAVFVVVLVCIFNSVCIRLNLDSPYLLLGLSALAVLSCWQPLACVMLQGMQRFYTGMVVGIVDVCMRLALAVLLIPLFRLSGYFFAVMAAGAVTLGISFWSLRAFIGGQVRGESYYEDWKGILSFMWPLAVLITFGNFQGFMEPFVIKHFLSTADSAGYYMVRCFGYIPAYLVGSVGFVLFPLLSHRHERGEDTQRYLRQALAVTAAVSAAGTVVMGLCAHWIFGLRPQWRPFVPYASLVWPVGILVTIESVVGIYTTHETACRRFFYGWIVVPVGVLETLFLYGSFGWTAFHGMVPESAWHGIALLLPRTLANALWVMVAARATVAAGLATQWRRAANGEEGCGSCRKV